MIFANHSIPDSLDYRARNNNELPLHCR